MNEKLKDSSLNILSLTKNRTRNVTTADSSSSKNRDERDNINLEKQNDGLSPVFNITELNSSESTLNL